MSGQGLPILTARDNQRHRKIRLSKHEEIKRQSFQIHPSRWEKKSIPVHKGRTNSFEIEHAADIYNSLGKFKYRIKTSIIKGIPNGM